MILASAPAIELWGAGCFGGLIGWYVYYINRNRTDKVQLGDLVTLIGAIGGASITTIFPASSELFGAYGIGLAAGFFAYFVVLIVFVGMSKGVFKATWFLDGRRENPKPEEGTGPVPLARRQ
jgi:hypothetical protein